LEIRASTHFAGVVFDSCIFYF